VKPEEFSFDTYGVIEGMKIDVTFHNQGIYPKECRGRVEKVYRCFAVVKTRHYRVTVHYTDLLTGTASVKPAVGPGKKTASVVQLIPAVRRNTRGKKILAAFGVI